MRVRVRFVTDWFEDGVKVHAVGDTKDLDEASALRFIRRGVAEEAADAEPTALPPIRSAVEAQAAMAADTDGERSSTIEVAQPDTASDVTPKPPRRKKP